MNIIETVGLGKNYGRTWALRDCTFAMPEGHLAALVGPNGAGKTTLLHLLVGLTPPAAGTATVLGGLPAGSRAALDGIAFVAQDAPVYTNLTAADMIRLARNLNRSFDPPYARARLGELDIPLDRKAAKLSGGQRAQLALSLALARAVGLYLRQHYLLPLVIASANGPAPSAWTLSAWYTGRGGQVVPGDVVNAACPGPGPGNSTPGSPPQCMSQHGYTQWWSYQPASRYWPFQGIEGGGLLLLAILLITATIWLVHRRAA